MPLFTRPDVVLVCPDPLRMAVVLFVLEDVGVVGGDDDDGDGDDDDDDDCDVIAAEVWIETVVEETAGAALTWVTVFPIPMSRKLSGSEQQPPSTRPESQHQLSALVQL